MMKLYVKPSQGHASASIYFSDFKYPELEAKIAMADDGVMVGVLLPSSNANSD